MNFLVLAQGALALAEMLTRYTALMAAATAEGRDISDAEMAELFSETDALAARLPK